MTRTWIFCTRSWSITAVTNTSLGRNPIRQRYSLIVKLQSLGSFQRRVLPHSKTRGKVYFSHVYAEPVLSMAHPRNFDRKLAPESPTWTVSKELRSLAVWRAE